MDDPGFWSRFAVAALAAWRITHLLAMEDGPADAIVRVRARLGDGLAGRLLDCFYCLSVWVAAPMALLVCRDPLERLAVWVALSGAACLLERMTDEHGARKAVRDELLRSEARSDAEHGGAREAGPAHEGAPAGFTCTTVFRIASRF